MKGIDQSSQSSKDIIENLEENQQNQNNASQIRPQQQSRRIALTDQNDSNGDIPLMQLRNFFCDMAVFPSNKTKGIRAIIITDSHLGKFMPARPQIPRLYDYLQKVVNENNANIVFWLGDMVDIRADDRENIGQLFIDTFSKFPIPIEFISGNHDRGLYRRIKVYGSMHYNPEKIIKLESSSGLGNPLFFAHDFGNPYRLSNLEVPSFLKSNKVAQRDKIGPDDWLIIGHTHFTYLNEEEKIASLAPFSFDFRNFSYGLVIDEEDGFKFTFHKLQRQCNVASLVKAIEEGKNEEES